VLEALTDIAYTGHADLDSLTQAVRDVFEPGASAIRRAVGHPEAPLMADSLIMLIRARLEAVARLAGGAVTDDELCQARHAHLLAYAEYAIGQPAFAAWAPAATPDMYEPVTAENTLVNACGHLLTALGLNALHPQRAAQIQATSAPRIVFGSSWPIPVGPAKHAGWAAHRGGDAQPAGDRVPAERCRSRALVCSGEGRRRLGLPWWDRSDSERWARSEQGAPFGDSDSPFEDEEQGWRLVIWKSGEMVYVLAGDEDVFRVWFSVSAERYLSAWAALA